MAEKIKKYKVTIHSGEDKDSGDVVLGVNGKLIQVQRNKEVILPAEYVEVLRNAKIETIVKDPETGKESPITMMRFPFSAVEA